MTSFAVYSIASLIGTFVLVMIFHHIGYMQGERGKTSTEPNLFWIIFGAVVINWIIVCIWFYEPYTDLRKRCVDNHVAVMIPKVNNYSELELKLIPELSADEMGRFAPWAAGTIMAPRGEKQ